jgi:hypothetical protein
MSIRLDQLLKRRRAKLKLFRLSHRSSCKSKLRNVRIKQDGYSFASKLEAAVYQTLKLRARAGEIEILLHQCRILLSDAEVCYVPDFKCRDQRTQEVFFVEAKGFETPEWKIKKRLWSAYGPAPLHIWRGTHNRPFLEEVLVPKSNARNSGG